MSLLQRNKPLNAPRNRPSGRAEQERISKLERILAALDQATHPEEMDLPGFRLRPMRGKHKGHFSVWVTGDWRMTFRFDGQRAVEIDYVEDPT